MPRSKVQKEPEFYISAVKDGDGYTYSLSPGPREWLQQRAPHAQPTGRIFIAQDANADFKDTQERIAPFLVPMLLGLPLEEVKPFGDIPFCHPYPFKVLFTWRASESTTQTSPGTSATTLPTR